MGNCAAIKDKRREGGLKRPELKGKQDPTLESEGVKQPAYDLLARSKTNMLETTEMVQGIINHITKTGTKW